MFKILLLHHSFGCFATFLAALTARVYNRCAHRSHITWGRHQSWWEGFLVLCLRRKNTHELVRGFSVTSSSLWSLPPRHIHPSHWKTFHPLPFSVFTKSSKPQKIPRLWICTITSTSNPRITLSYVCLGTLQAIWMPTLLHAWCQKLTWAIWFPAQLLLLLPLLLICPKAHILWTIEWLVTTRQKTYSAVSLYAFIFIWSILRWKSKPRWCTVMAQSERLRSGPARASFGLGLNMVRCLLCL